MSAFAKALDGKTFERQQKAWMDGLKKNTGRIISSDSERGETLVYSARVSRVTWSVRHTPHASASRNHV